MKVLKVSRIVVDEMRFYGFLRKVENILIFSENFLFAIIKVFQIHSASFLVIPSVDTNFNTRKVRKTN
jgi:hypothetical protein